MINEIIVYDRKTYQQIDVSRCRFSADLVLWVGDIGTPQEQRYFLSKKDPSNKFKRTMKGWWFCERYVVIEYCVGDIVFEPIKRYHDNGYKYEHYYRIVTLVEECPIAGMYYKRNNMAKEVYEYKEHKDGTIYKEYQDFECVRIYNAVVAILPQFKTYQTKDIKINYTIGEDKYIKLLELINL